MSTMVSTVERARGRWREILPRLGVEERFLVKRQGPCPMCGGKTRFRFDDKSEGWFYCNQCGAGPGIVLLRKLHQWDYATACREVDKIIGTDYRPEPAAKRAPPSDNTKLNAIERLFAGQSDDKIVAEWLASKGLGVSSDFLFGRRACPLFDENGLVGHVPAVVVPIFSPIGELVSAQRLYIRENLKKVMPPVGTINGGSVKLHDYTDELGVAEGVATALAAYQLFGVPTWAALSANGLKAFEPPPGVRKLVIFADNDVSYVGQAAAFDLAHRLSNRPQPIECTVNVPDEPDTDWRDVLNQRVLT